MLKLFILGGRIIEWKNPCARTSKQKRGWAFIQDGLIFARVRYWQAFVRRIVQCSLLQLMRTTRMTLSSHWLSIVNQKLLFLKSGVSIVLAQGSKFSVPLQRSSLSSSGLIIWMMWTSLSSFNVQLTTWCLEWRVSTKKIDCGGLSVARGVTTRNRVDRFPQHL